MSELALLERAKGMTSLNSYKILAIDMSYRESGVSLLTYEGSIITVSSRVIQNPELGYIGFRSLVSASANMKTTIERISETMSENSPDVTIIEMPCFSQSAKSAIAIGILWGAVSTLDCILVEPSILKRWSDSARGDKKTKVKEKVLERVILAKYEASNNNIVDAVGLTLLFHDTIRKQKYAETNS